jgi:hypothetical protein
VEPPNYKAIPDETDILDSTIIMIIVYYKQKKFFRCSYLIRQFYLDEETNENKPESIQWEKLYREIRTDKPIITTYDVVWDENNLAGHNNIKKNDFTNVNLFTDEPSLKQQAEQQERDATLKQLNEDNQSMVSELDQ